MAPPMLAEMKIGGSMYTRVVLGIDAAWTSTQPSGVAVAAKNSRGWRLIAAESSYQRFLALADKRLQREQRPSGSLADARALLAAASVLCKGHAVDLVAIDMPLAQEAITGRRFCDNEVSRTFGARKCGTHSPTPARPGPVSEELRKGFDLAGYPLLTRGISSRGLIEVYPHPALVELTGASERLPYKTPKTRTYWPSATPTERRARLYQQWKEIINLLEGEIANVSAVLSIPDITATKGEAKACEDALDAIICAWVALCALEGRARPLGDENSAIWIPYPRVAPAPKTVSAISN
jgi:predicted RNase H-like nuclease